MSKNWTKGPWVRCMGPTADVRAGDPQTGQMIANTVGFIPTNRAITNRRLVECRANADLIAASPELYDALEPFAALLKPHHDDLPDAQPLFAIEDTIIHAGDLRRAAAALAKARGES